MEMAPQPFPAVRQASLSDAKLAYFEGDFERCLEVCAAIRVRSLATASEIALLSTRAYLRTGRAAEAERTLHDAAPTHLTLDAALTAQMLLGSARIRQSDPDGGLAILAAAAERAAKAHLAVRSEIAFARALGYWAKRDLDTAERYLSQVDRRSDIIHARALELAAWCQMSRGNYRRCAELFILTLLRLDQCGAQDRVIVATAISTLSIIAAELFDRELALVVDQRTRTMDWTSGLAAQHYLTLHHNALFAEIAGNTIAAYELAMQARAIAPTTAFEAVAWSLSSGIARNADELCASAVYAQRARQVLAGLELRELVDEERFSILAVAESCAHCDSASADRLFAAYWGLAPVNKMLALSGDPRLMAEEAFISGVVAQGRGDTTEAALYYRKAFEHFERIGYVRRAVMAAHAFGKLGHDDRMQNYIREKLRDTANYITRASISRGDEPAPVERHPIVVNLPRAQREVVVLICQGKTNKEIAHLRNVGEQTIKNMLTKHVFRAFGVSSRAALVSTCLRGGA